MLDRVSTNLLFSLSSKTIRDNQSSVYDLANKVSLGKKYVNSYEDPQSLMAANTIKAKLLANEQVVRDRQTSISDLNAQEIALTSILDITDRIHEITVAAGSDTIAAEERIIYNNEIQKLGESIVQFVNSKVGERYIFSGQQSDLQTIRLEDNASFEQAIYKHNQDNGLERMIDTTPTSVSLKDSLLAEAASAKLISNVINPVSTKTGDINFEVDDGNGTLTNFSVTINVGDDLNTIINAINTSFTGAGGLGAIAQESPSGYLQMNTDLVTGSTNNKQAKISVQSTSDLNVTNELGISRQDYYGREMGLLRSISTLQTALTANDSSTIRNMIDQFKFNMGELNASRSMVGLYLSNAERLNSASEDLDLKLQTDLSLKEDLDMIDATVKMNNLQVALQAAVQTTANMFSISIGNFL